MCNNILQQKIILRRRKQCWTLRALAQGLYASLWSAPITKYIWHDMSVYKGFIKDLYVWFLIDFFVLWFISMKSHYIGRYEKLASSSIIHTYNIYIHTNNSTIRTSNAFDKLFNGWRHMRTNGTHYSGNIPTPQKQRLCKYINNGCNYTFCDCKTKCYPRT